MTSLAEMGPSASVPSEMYTSLKYTSPWLAMQDFSDSFQTQSIIKVGGNSWNQSLEGNLVVPMGQDQWKLFYTNYEIFASRITFELVADEGDGTGEYTPLLFCIVPLNESADMTSYTNKHYSDLPYASMCKQLGHIGGSKDHVTLSHYARTRDILGAALCHSDSLSAAVDTQPTDEWFWYGCATCVDNGNVIKYPTARFQLSVVWYTRFFGRNNLAMS